jgi:hypothetical protein
MNGMDEITHPPSLCRVISFLDTYDIWSYLVEVTSYDYSTSL